MNSPFSAFRYFFDHLVKPGFDLRFEVGFDLVSLGKFGKSPTSLVAKVVQARLSK